MRCESLIFQGSHEEAVAQAIRLARRITSRVKVLSLLPEIRTGSADSAAVEAVVPLKASLLCRAIAESNQRIAAIVLGPVPADPLILKRFTKRVRELASAEGAFMIWDEADSAGVTRELGVEPDLLCRLEDTEPDRTSLFGRSDVIGGEKK